MRVYKVVIFQTDIFETVIFQKLYPFCLEFLTKQLKVLKIDLKKGFSVHTNFNWDLTLNKPTDTYFTFQL
jgi:hypothetical protein